jgi:hypothetical protein
MSEPTRLRDQSPDAVRELLHHAPKTQAMSAAARSRTRVRVARFAAISAGVGSLAWLQGAAIGAGLGVLAVGAAEVVPTWLAPVPTALPAPTAPTRALAPSPTSSPRPDATLDRSAPSVEPAGPATSASAEAPPLKPVARPSEVPETAVDEGSAPAPARPTDSLAQEAALLERARASLGASPAEALALTEAHAAQFPGGKLSMEREFVAIDALRRLGRSAQARARGEALLPRVRGGLYEERLKELLDRMR